MRDPYFRLIDALRDEIRELDALDAEKDEWLAEMRAGRKSDALLKLGMTKREAQAMAEGAGNTLATVIPELKKILREAESHRLRLVRSAPQGGNQEEPETGQEAHYKENGV
ncbi:hypothetical protein NYO91_07195 [Arhodomonas aquaeolei]|uniref:hypothetical protein n=1 Tax=Arhodomonas aquaeolei TaxID=2369 RepID=UPI002168D29C|nr:hypothetical protein [Arhodomonas aquaeolei]MCS4503861.1 hypothetical protein [Arhodomonas aquaeolei]